MTWEAPPDPDLANLAKTGWAQWLLDRPKIVAFDTETTGLEHHDRPFCATIAWKHDDVVTGEQVVGHYFEFDRIDCRQAACTILEQADVLVAHNAKFDLHKMAQVGYELRPHQELHDTEAMAHLDDEHRPKGLKALAVSVLGFDDVIDVPGKRRDPETGKQVECVRQVPRSKHDLDNARKWAKKHHGLDSVDAVGYDLLPRGVVVPYAVLDAVWTYDLASALYPRVSQYPDLLGLYEAEMELTRTAILEMESAGMAVRSDYVDEQVIAYRKRLLRHELAIEALVGKPVRTGKMTAKERPDFFNPASNDELAKYFRAAGHDRESYDAEALETIAHPLAARLVEYRQDAKIMGYFVQLQNATGPDGLVHPSLRQHGTVTGRTSSGKERGD